MLLPLLLTVVLPVSSPAAPPTPSAATLLVLDPTGERLNVDQRRMLASSLGASLARALSGTVDVITVSDVRGMLSVEARRQEVGCDDASCASEIAGALGSTQVVVSHVVRLGDVLTLSTELLDVRTARVLARGEVSGSGVKAVKDHVDDATRPLAAALRPSSTWAMVAWPAGFIGGAMVVAAGGVAWDAMAPSSKNGRLDMEDLMGPAAYLGAAGLVAVAFLNPLERE